MPRLKPTPIQRVCATCGKTFEFRSCRTKWAPGKFCSRPCGRVGGTPESRFWDRVKKTSTCWIWTGSFNDSGYGQIRIDGELIRAHRFSWELHRQPIPYGLCVLHDCPDGDNRACVNPDHLRLGTRTDNSQDRCKKGRTPTGGACSWTKLTPEQVLEIRRLHALGHSARSLGRQFSVHAATVSCIVRCQTWKHI